MTELGSRPHDLRHGRGRRREAVSFLVTVCAVSLAIIPTVASGALTRPAFRTLNLGRGETSQNVCSMSVAAGYAHCNAQVRTDPTSREERPYSRNSPTTTLGDDGAYSPAFLQSAYNIPSADTVDGGGAGQIVAIVDAYSDPNIVNDLAYYRTYFGLPACPAGSVSPLNAGCVFEQVNESGATSPLPSANSSWGVETSLDVEMVSAICPTCQILLVEASSSSITDLGTSVNTAISLGADVVSNSYGANEYASETADSLAYYDHPGVPVVAASGDSGYGVEFPAASPYVVAVGGTTLTQNTDSGARDGVETAWSDAGAGCSAYEPKPSWQRDTGCANRTVADVSADANPATGVWIYDSYGESGFAIYGGTSVAAPIVSSIFALAGSALDGASYPASYLYDDPSALYQVTSGSDGACGTYLCNAAESQNGYNGPTGLGTPGGSPNSLAAFGAATAASSPTVPASPTLESATASGGSVDLTWTAPADGGSAITGYDVYDGTSSGQESATPINALPIVDTSNSVTGLTNGTTYYFTVEAINAVGPSGPSNELSATPTSTTVTVAPILTMATGGNGTASLVWSAPSSDGGSAVTGYDVYMGTTSGGESTTPLDGSPVSSTSATVTGLSNGTTYYFVVSALNGVGNSPVSNELSAKPATTPGAPNSLKASTSSTKGVALSWNAPTSTGGSAVSKYVVYRSTSSGKETAYSTVICATSSCSFSDTGTKSGTVYYYEVAAVNSVGTGPRSAPASAKAK